MKHKILSNIIARISSLASLVTFNNLPMEAKIVLIYTYSFIIVSGERYDFVIEANNIPGAYWIQVRGLGECGIKRAQQLAILRYARGPYQPSSQAPTYDVGVPQGVVSFIQNCVNIPCKIIETFQNIHLKLLVNRRSSVVKGHRDTVLVIAGTSFVHGLLEYKTKDSSCLY